MNNSAFNSLNAVQRNFIDGVVRTTRHDGRFSGVLLAGSALNDSLDDYSDLDFILVCRGETVNGTFAARMDIARSLGDFVSGFTGEHVGEPRLLICLYASPALHVDLKFVTLDALDQRVETPRIAWADDDVRHRLEQGKASWPVRPPEWFEERIWIWVHYGLAKVGRGELFEAIGMLNFLREQVLGPLVSLQYKRDQRGVRRIELYHPAFAESLRSTLCSHERGSVLKAYRNTVDIYLSLRNALFPHGANRKGEELASEYMSSLEAAGT